MLLKLRDSFPVSIYLDLRVDHPFLIDTLHSWFHSQNWSSALFSSLHACMHAKSLQSHPTLCDPMDCNPSRSSVHGFFQARILEWVAFTPPGDLPNSGIETVSLATLSQQADSLLLSHLGSLSLSIVSSKALSLILMALKPGYLSSLK